MKLKHILRRSAAPKRDDEVIDQPQFEKIGENLTPNMRALRLAMTASDTLLSMGVSANSVVSRALDITETYCARPVHVDISLNQITFSQLRGVEKEPLTIVRPVPTREVNYRTVQDVQRLIYKIANGDHTLDQAEQKLDEILAQPASYPWWLIMIGNAGIVAGVSLVFTNSWKVVVTNFVIGLLVDRLLAALAKRSIPTFFRQIVAAAFVTLSAAIVALMAREGIDFFAGMNPTLIVVGGIIMLVAGLAIVGAIQDAIEEFYITANARILKASMQTVGIVVGILIGLYTARQLGFGIAVSPDPLTLNTLDFQLIGAGITAAAYALSTNTYWRAIAWAGAIGSLAVAVTYFARQFEIAIIPASGVAAILVGLAASMLSRLWRTPSVGIIAAGIIPLVPGLALYNGLMQLINYPPGDPLFARGLGTLFTAVATALSIAAGASFGSMIGRPIRQKITHSRNMMPFMNLMRRQLGFDRKHNLGALALGRLKPPVDQPNNE